MTNLNYFIPHNHYIILSFYYKVLIALSSCLPASTLFYFLSDKPKFCEMDQPHTHFVLKLKECTI